MMKPNYVDQCLNFCCNIAHELVRNGAEMYRVEESARRILSAYGFENPEVFAIPACILITVQSEGHNYTKSVRIHSSANNLDKLEKLNSLCRQVCFERTALDEADERLHTIMSEPDYPLWVSYLGYGSVAFFFTLLFGGVLFDAAISFCCGLIVKITTSKMTKMNANVFFVNLIASMFLVTVPVFLRFLVVPIHPDKVIIGAIMLLVPGVAITNVMRDVIVGDFLTAISKLTEVLIVALAIAIGIALPYGFARVVFGVI